MRKTQFEGLVQKLLPRLPGYSVSGWLLHRSPADGVLLGFCCDPSGIDPDHFALVAFALPLFMPLPGGFHLNFGRRLRDGEGREIRWNRHGADLDTSLPPAIQRADADFFHHHLAQGDPATLLRSLGESTDPYLSEALAFCHARAGRPFPARQAIRALSRSRDPSIHWHNAMATRLATLDTLLDADPMELAPRMKQWVESNQSDLGLPLTSQPIPDMRSI